MSVQAHYKNLLAAHYTWMCGGHEAKIAEAIQFFESQGIRGKSGARALDLGCGPGFQSIALAELGFDVLSIDTSQELLHEVVWRSAGRAIRAACGDMRDASLYASSGPFDVAVCMGDSLTLLDSFEEVEALLRSSHAALAPDGKIVLSFRDLSRELTGADRILPVKSDADTIMTVFLEYDPEHVNVHDLVYVREGGGWTLRKSVYKKLRLGAEKVVGALKLAGFMNVQVMSTGGFLNIVANKQDN